MEPAGTGKIMKTAFSGLICRNREKSKHRKGVTFGGLQDSHVRLRSARASAPTAPTNKTPIQNIQNMFLNSHARLRCMISGFQPVQGNEKEQTP